MSHKSTSLLGQSCRSLSLRCLAVRLPKLVCGSSESHVHGNLHRPCVLTILLRCVRIHGICCAGLFIIVPKACDATRRPLLYAVRRFSKVCALALCATPSSFPISGLCSESTSRHSSSIVRGFFLCIHWSLQPQLGVVSGGGPRSFRDIDRQSAFLPGILRDILCTAVLSPVLHPVCESPVLYPMLNTT